MPYGREEWLDRFRQRRDELIRLIYRRRIRRSQLIGGSEHDRSRNVTPGQAHVVDDLLTQNIDGLAREALFALKQDGLPPERLWNEFIAQLEFPNGEETSDAQALLMLETVASSDWNQLVAHKDSPEPVLLHEEQSKAQEPQPIVVIEEAHEGALDIVGEISRWDELEEFVNTDLAELQRRAVENPEIIHENMALLEDIFGYDVRFHDDEFYVGEGRNAEKKSAIKQIFNLASSHYHVTNTFGIEIMRTTARATIYHLGADEIAGGRFVGRVPLAAGETGSFIGSEMTIGGITHETFHEIDRRFDRRPSVPNYDDEREWGLEWYLREKVDYLENHVKLGFNFGMVLDSDDERFHLNEDSRASDMVDNREIFPDVAAAVVFGLHEEDFFSKAFVSDPDNRIGFASYGNSVKSLICGIHQYFEHIVNGVTEPEQLTYDEGACIQFWSEQ